jgi:hypothetical protein
LVLQNDQILVRLEDAAGKVAKGVILIETRVSTPKARE